jgi:DNA-binding NtrC family response regulator
VEPAAKRILVVDNDSNVRSALQRYFVDNDWEVETADCGREALEKLTAVGLFQVVVADYFMPNINGIEFLKQVNLEFPETYCIMLTAYSFCDSINYAMRKYLRAELLQKPWDDRLLKAAEQSLTARQLPDEAQPF